MHHTEQKEKVLLAGIAPSQGVCVSVCVSAGGSCVVWVLIYCRRWKPGMQKDGEATQQTPTGRQTGRISV